jgi:hypothetical protein
MPRPMLDPRNLARVRTQVWFAEMALKSLLAEAAAADPLAQAETEDLLIPIVHLLELAQIKLSDRIDDARRPSST